MSEETEKTYDSLPSYPQDEFWLELGRKMVEGSLDAVRQAARSLMTGLGLLKAVYLGILGFADYVPATMPAGQKIVYAIPALLWLISLYLGLRVMLTRRLEVNINSPDDIRRNSESVLNEKQRYLRWAFWLLAVGLVAGLLLIVVRPGV